MSKATNQFNTFLAGITKTVKEVADKAAMTKLADFATELVVKRTRLGYAVGKNYGAKGKFAKLSDRYIKIRKKSKLDSLTRPTKSNLTRTGQMLASMKGRYVSRGTIVIEPTGSRDDGLTNLEVAEFAHEGSSTRPKRPFNRVSALEFQQILRFYRKTFGDLIKKSSRGRLIR